MPGLSRLAQMSIGCALILSVAGCDVLGSPVDAFSSKRTPPDEFQVLARKPLKMPGTLDLPEPRLGEASPLEPDPNTDAIVALLGVPSTTTGAQPSAGERALLAAANASATDGETAAELERSAVALEQQQPYQPPTLVELLSSGETVPEDALDPTIEAQRLQREGAGVTPVDPNVAPPEPERAPNTVGGTFTLPENQE